MAALGLIAGPVLCAGGIAVLFDLIEVNSALKALAATPEFVWELGEAGPRRVALGHFDR